MRILRLALLAALAWVVDLVWVLTPVGRYYTEGWFGTVWRVLPAVVFVLVLGWVLLELWRWRRRLGVTRARRATPADIAAQITRASRRTRR